MHSPNLLVVGTSIDPHIDEVVGHMPDHLSVARLNIDEFPKSSQLTINHSQNGTKLFFETEELAADITYPDVVWFRRLGKIGISENVPEKYKKFCGGEAEMALEGLLSLMKPMYWVNEYWSTKRAANKPYQYSHAINAGLEMPQTLITNSYCQTVEWLRSVEHPIAKSLHAPLITDDESEDGRTFAYTRALQPSDFSQLKDIETAPCQFQPNIPKAYELRVTSFGNEHIAVRINSPKEGMDDWRAAAKDCAYDAWPFSEKAARKLRALMTSMGIEFAASDFVVTPDEKLVFLESNPHGAWLWLDEALPQLEITKKFAKYIGNLVIKGKAI